jgi:hypothetical protein
MRASEIAAIARAVHANVRTIADPLAALEQALRLDRTTVVAGSIFLIGPLRGHLYRGILR